MSAEEAFIKVDEWDLFESESDDEHINLKFFDDLNINPMDTDIECSGYSDEKSDSFDSNGCSVWEASNLDFRLPSFTVQNPEVHFRFQPELELAAF